MLTSGTVILAVGGVNAEVDPTVQPVRASLYVFLFLALATLGLIVSMLRHMRRARVNLSGPDQSLVAGPSRAAQPSPAAPGASGQGRATAPGATGAGGTAPGASGPGAAGPSPTASEPD